MKKENAHLFLPLVQALADGKTIQIESYGSGDLGWDSFEDDEEIRFCEDPEKYRIRPETRTFEMWLTPAGSMHTSSQMSHAPWKISDCERITVQEVLK